MTFYFLCKEEAPLVLNFDLFETNIINLALLISLLLYIASTTFKDSLEKRKAEIIQTLSLAQEDLLKSSNYYKESSVYLNKNLSYLQLWRSFYLIEKKEKIWIKYNVTRQNILSNYFSIVLSIKSCETKALFLLQRYIILRVASKILRKFFGLPKKDQEKVLEQVLSALGGT